MLILTRKQGQSFTISDDIEVTVSEISGDKVRIAIDAPQHIKILRKELSDATCVNQEAAASHPDPAALKSLFAKKQ